MSLEDVRAMADNLPEIPQQRRLPLRDDYQSTNPTVRIMAMVLRGEVPKNPSDFNEWFRISMDNASGNPNCTLETIRRWNRIFKDINATAFSEGMADVAASMMRNLNFEMRSFMARGDNPHQGLSGVSSIITSRQDVEQRVKIPQQPNQPGLFGISWSRKKGGE